MEGELNRHSTALGVLILFASVAEVPCMAVDGLSDACGAQGSTPAVKLLEVPDSDRTA